MSWIITSQFNKNGQKIIGTNPGQYINDMIDEVKRVATNGDFGSGVDDFIMIKKENETVNQDTEK